MTDGTKPMEIELKLVLPGPEAESAVVAHMREHGYRVEELDPVRNVDTLSRHLRLVPHEK